MDDKTALPEAKVAGALLLLWAPTAPTPQSPQGGWLPLGGADRLSEALPSALASGLARQLMLLAQQLEQGCLPPAALPAARALRSGPFQVDAGHGLVRWRGPGGWRVLELTEVERRLLRQLLQAGGEVCSRSELAHGLWGAETHHLRTVDQCVRRLRASLLEAGVPDCIRTVRGLGYRLLLEPAQTR